MPPDPPSKSASGAQKDLGLNRHPYLTLSYAPAFCDKNGNLAHNHKFLNMYKKCKTADKTLEQYFLHEFKATCKNASEAELKQQH